MTAFFAVFYIIIGAISSPKYEFLIEIKRLVEKTDEKGEAF